MAETNTLEDLKSVMDGGGVTAEGEAPVTAALPEPKIDEHGRSYATGKRKNSIARVWPLKAAGFITRDSRVVERKKYGKAKARKSFQF